jgi:hypothetical protein
MNPVCFSLESSSRVLPIVSGNKRVGGMPVNVKNAKIFKLNADQKPAPTVLNNE